jgi:hypothetical protein
MSARYASSTVRLVGLFSAFAAGGCSLWQATEVVLPELPATRMSEDTVVWEIGAVYVPKDDDRFHDSLWVSADEQVLPVDLTRRLATHGFRCGLVGMPLPTVLRQRLDEHESPASEGSGSIPVSELTGGYERRRLQARAGQRYEVVGGPVQDDMTAVFQEEGEIRGQRFSQAQCVLAMRSFPQGDGRVRLEVTPEIHFGPPRRHYEGMGGAFQVQAKRDRKVFSELSFEVLFSPGQTLLLTASRQSNGLGRLFFSSSPDGRTRQKFLLVRLAQTQYDDRFAPDQGKPTGLVTSKPEL